jgi:hypothetical protein
MIGNRDHSGYLQWHNPIMIYFDRSRISGINCHALLLSPLQEIPFNFQLLFLILPCWLVELYNFGCVFRYCGFCTIGFLPKAVYHCFLITYLLLEQFNAKSDMESLELNPVLQLMIFFFQAESQRHISPQFITLLTFTNTVHLLTERTFWHYIVMSDPLLELTGFSQSLN